MTLGDGAASPALDRLLEPVLFHRDVVELLTTREAELWKWFSSTAFLDDFAASTRLELLKSCYRFDPIDHADLYSLVERVRDRLGLLAPVTLYQSQDGIGMNASLCFVPSEVHLVLQGPLRSTLTQDEFASIVAHELAHFLLWERDQRELLVADQLLCAMAAHPRSEPSHAESARLFRLYLEVLCDRAALAVSPDPLIAIAALVKVQTGLSDVKAERYLAQSDEIFGTSEVKTDGLTHPESFIRARALKLFADGAHNADTEIARMIEGPLDLGRLSLPGQARLTELTRRVLLRFFSAPVLRTEPLVAHARMFFSDLDPAATEEVNGAALREAIVGASPSVHRYLCYVLLDLATVDPQLEQAPLAAVIGLADDLGIGDAFLARAAEELRLGKRVLAKLRRESGRVLLEAEGTNE